MSGCISINRNLKPLAEVFYQSFKNFSNKDMAKINNQTLLGYEDELITEKHKNQVNYTVNKIGGEADFPPNFTTQDKNPICKLCELPSRLVVQIYAPLDNTAYDRTLYLFACINPNCWNRSESWRCIRVQSDKVSHVKSEETHSLPIKLGNIDWCVDADDWGDDDTNANLVEENCNSINTHNARASDDEESSSFDESVQSCFVSLSIDDTNANIGAQGGAVGRLHSPMATAEIEGDEGEIITVETPTTPKTNLAALLHEVTPLPRATTGAFDCVPFVSHFMSVWPEEDLSSSLQSDNHVKELLAEYQRQGGDLTPEDGGPRIDKSGGGDRGDANMAIEEYEKSKPLHGDKMFHHFLTKIKENPEQILRYNRDGHPLFLYPLQEQPKRCQYCQDELTFEFQLVPTIISKLKLECDPAQRSRLEFGTVLVYTCLRSCWSSNDVLKEEVVVVQRENY